MYLTLSYGRLTGHIFFFLSKSLSLNLYSCTHLCASCPVKPTFLSAVAAEKLCWSSLGSATKKIKSTHNSHWESFTHLAPQMRFFSVQCADCNQWPSKHILASLIFSLLLLPAILTKMISVWVCLGIYRLQACFFSFFSFICNCLFGSPAVCRPE